MGLAFYLIGCIITFFLLNSENKNKVDFIVILFIALSWGSIVLALLSLADKHYKQLEDKEE